MSLTACATCASYAGTLISELGGQFWFDQRWLLFRFLTGLVTVSTIILSAAIGTDFLRLFKTTSVVIGCSLFELSAGRFSFRYKCYVDFAIPNVSSVCYCSYSTSASRSYSLQYLSIPIESDNTTSACDDRERAPHLPKDL